MAELTTPCTPWTGRLNRDGYGRVSCKGVDRFAHRVAAEALRNHVSTNTETWADIARAALTAALGSVEETARVLAAHRTTGPRCTCGWRPALMLNDTASDRAQYEWHQAEALHAHLLGVTETKEAGS